MKKNIIIYIVAGAIILAGIATAGVLAFNKLNGDGTQTTEPTLNYGENQTDFGANGYPIIEEPSEEFYTNENGEIIEYRTDEEGSTFEVVLETNTNGEVVTEESGEKVTVNKPNVVVTKPAGTTKPGSKPVATTKPGKKPVATTKPSTGSGGQGLSGGNTVQKNPDGSQTIVKPDGTIALSYSYSAAGNYFYTDDNPWQRNFGFNRLYDIGAVFTVMYLDTFHVYYNHGGYDWMVQFWKGQYGLLFLGGEIGLYYKDPGKSTQHFNCAEEDMEINMQMTVYREGYGELFTRPYAPHWWTTAFVPGKLKKFPDRTELTMVAKLEFKTEEERAKFCKALEKIEDGYYDFKFEYVSQISKNKPEQYTYNGKTVDLVWRFLDEDRAKPLDSLTPTTTAKPTEKPVETTKPAPTEPTTAPTTTPPVTDPPSYE